MKGFNFFFLIFWRLQRGVNLNLTGTLVVKEKMNIIDTTLIYVRTLSQISSTSLLGRGSWCLTTCFCLSVVTFKGTFCCDPAQSYTSFYLKKEIS